MVPRVVMLFGLSADPPTGERGHAGIVRWGVEVLRVPSQEDGHGALTAVDAVWVLPVFQHAFAEKQNMTPYPHRLAMARLAFERLPGLEGRVQVRETERKVTETLRSAARSEGRDPSTVWAGTVDVVRWLREHHPDVRFVLVLGADTYRDYLQGKWKEGRTLERYARVIGLPRDGVPGLARVAGAAVEPPSLGAVSSTALRSSADPALWAREVLPEVLAYARAHRLYGWGEGGSAR